MEVACGGEVTTAGVVVATIVVDATTGGSGTITEVEVGVGVEIGVGAGDTTGVATGTGITAGATFAESPEAGCPERPRRSSFDAPERSKPETFSGVAETSERWSCVIMASVAQK